MRVIARITSQGKATVPREVREWLGLKPGDSVVFRMEGDRITLTPLRKDNPFDTFIGTLPRLPRDSKTFWRELRDGDDDE